MVKKKSRKMRGSRTCGWGVSGQHRKSGMRGGFGKAGKFNHKWSYMVTYGKKEVGKKGFKILRSKGNVINVNELEELIRDKLNQSTSINLVDLGYKKLLGGGTITKPVEVIVEKCSNAAKKKIEEAGGKVVLLAKSKEVELSHG
ncbi:uL15 family ribosomal protein [Candidatus Bathyarchaeota archaeon]|nr:uL15 family ribosomal protein [Candidatus Bathyarchaeota archaeon]